MEPTGAIGIVISAIIFVFGLVIGSFLNVVIYRLPREGLSPTRPHRSFCPVCHNQIYWYDNLPIVSWLLLKGRCRFCQTVISCRYPLVELLAGFLALFVFQTEGLEFRFIFVFYFTMCLVAIAFIDLELMVIPDLLIWPTLILGIVCSLITPNPHLTGSYVWLFLEGAGWTPRLISLAGALSGFIVGFLSLWLVAFLYKIWRGQTGLGDGDPPLMGLIGVYLGWTSIFPVIFAATLLALFSVAILCSFGRVPSNGVANRAIPFGPFLSLSALFWFFYGQRLLVWYWSYLPD